MRIIYIRRINITRNALSVNRMHCDVKQIFYYWIPICVGGGEIILSRDSRLLDCRRRVARTLLVLASVFAVCWMPYNLIQLVFDHMDQTAQESQLHKTVRFIKNIVNLISFCNWCHHLPFILQLLYYSLWLGHANSAANPLLYCLFSRNIRQSLKNLFQVNGRNLRHSSELIPMTHKRRTSVSKRWVDWHN